ncbi:MAG: nitrogenase component 1 [Planctomycetota bacterium]|jgi:nitrogenase molybdenum-iron protein alpha chain|nr:nitrogenase component 1 [Planctomycetota bacterium]
MKCELEADFTLKVPPSREASCRNTGYAFGGATRGLVKCAGRGCLNQCEREFRQSTNCQMYVSSLISFSVKDSVVIFHGPVGCGAQAHMIDYSVKTFGARRGVKMSGARWFSTNLDENDVIGGGENKLRQAIIEADRRFRPTAIFVINSCAPAIIGDDLDEVTNRVQSEVSATVVPIHSPGFKAKVFSSAYDVVYHGILQKFPFKPEPYLDYRPFSRSDPDYDLKVRDYEYRKSRTVNLYNAWSIGPDDEAEIRRLLEALGLNVRIFVEFKEPDEWRWLGEAALNVCFCHVHDLYFVEFLKEKLGMPYILPNIPIGLSATRNFVREIADFFGLGEEAERLIAKEEGELKAALAPLAAKIRGKRVLISGGYLRIGATGLFANELGLKVVGFRNFNYDMFGNKLFDELEEKIGNVSNVISTQSSELLNELKTLKPDFAISHPGIGIWLAKAGIPSITLFAQRFPFFGYRGAYALARRIVRTLANPNYTRNLAANVSLPYKEKWYRMAPYHFLVAKGDAVDLAELGAKPECTASGCDR